MSMGGELKLNPKRRRSASQLKMFRTCEERYRLIKFERVPQQESAASVQGSAVHHAAEQWELSGRTINIGDTFDVEFDRLLATTAERSPTSEWRVWGKGSDVQKDIETRRTLGRGQAETLAITFQTKKIAELPDGTPAVEVRFELDLGPCIVVGSIDRIDDHDGTMVVEDIKTGVREASPIQVGIYALAAREILGYDVWQGDFYYAKDGTYSPSYDLSRFTRAYLEDQFSIMEKKIEQRLLTPSPGGECFTCPVRTNCKEIGWKK